MRFATRSAPRRPHPADVRSWAPPLGNPRAQAGPEWSVGAAAIAKHCPTGDQVILEARHLANNFEGRDGKTLYRYSNIAGWFEFGASGKAADEELAATTLSRHERPPAFRGPVAVSARS